MIAKIKTRADFGGIVNYANDQKNKKKRGCLKMRRPFLCLQKIGQVLTSLSQNLPVSLIFCILGNQVKISQR